MGKFIVRISAEKCKSCELCRSVCPKNVIEMSKTVGAKGYFPAEAVRTEDCIGCQSCAIMCPDGAIEIFRED